MSTKVKRGLGLLVVAAVAWLALFGLSRLAVNGSGSGVLDALEAALVVVLVLVLIGGFLGGLVLLAWGLATRGSRRPASGSQD